ncbi:MAG: hypothetical protein M0R74_14925 [Dehalococcoidia bacterium]|nr:hypothetical protein [Dehalococcoidia bacterium]
MKLFQVRFALIAVAALLALGAAVSTINAATLDGPASTLAAHFQEGNGGNGVDVVPGVIWTLVGVTIGGIVLATFYMLKRRVGGFPENPSWVAPISIEKSETFPDEGSFGEGMHAEQAHAEH